MTTPRALTLLLVLIASPAYATPVFDQGMTDILNEGIFPSTLPGNQFIGFRRTVQTFTVGISGLLNSVDIANRFNTGAEVRIVTTDVNHVPTSTVLASSHRILGFLPADIPGT